MFPKYEYPFFFHFNRDLSEDCEMNGMTVCFKPIDLNGGVFVVGLSVCSIYDQFNKKIGRNIALGRANKSIERNESFYCKAANYSELKNIALSIFNAGKFKCSENDCILWK